MHYRIKLAEENLEKARDRLMDTADIIQANCKHKHICETPSKHYEYIQWRPDYRVCLDCGKDEEASPYSYNILGDQEGRYIMIEKDRSQFYDLRVMGRDWKKIDGY